MVEAILINIKRLQSEMAEEESKTTMITTMDLQSETAEEEQKTSMIITMDNPETFVEPDDDLTADMQFVEQQDAGVARPNRRRVDNRTVLPGQVEELVDAGVLDGELPCLAHSVEHYNYQEMNQFDVFEDVKQNYKLLNDETLAEIEEINPDDPYSYD